MTLKTDRNPEAAGTNTVKIQEEKRLIPRTPCIVLGLGWRDWSWAMPLAGATDYLSSPWCPGPSQPIAPPRPQKLRIPPSCEFLPSCYRNRNSARSNPSTPHVTESRRVLSPPHVFQSQANLQQKDQIHSLFLFAPSRGSRTRTPNFLSVLNTPFFPNPEEISIRSTELPSTSEETAFNTPRHEENQIILSILFEMEIQGKILNPASLLY